MYEEINEMLSDGPGEDAEEHAIHDHEGFEGYSVSEWSGIDEHLSYYIDYDRMGRDMEMSGDIFTVETAHNEVHVFGNC